MRAKEKQERERDAGTDGRARVGTYHNALAAHGAHGKGDADSDLASGDQPNILVLTIVACGSA